MALGATEMKAHYDPLQLLMHAADHVGNAAVAAIDGVASFASTYGPGAASDAVKSVGMMVGGLEEAGRNFAGAAVDALTPAAKDNQFASLLGGVDLSWNQAPQVNAEGHELGQLSAQLNQFATKSQGFSVGLA